MKRYQIIMLAAAAVVGGTIVLSKALAQTTRPEAPTTKTVVCDVVQVFKNYARAKDLTQKLSERLDSIKVESEKRVRAIERLKASLDDLKVGSKEYNDLLDQMSKLSIERDAWLSGEDYMGKQDNYRQTMDMYEEILKMVEKVAKDRGFQIVLFKEALDQQNRNLDELLQQMARRKVLYSDPSLDITEEVLLRLNEQYKAQK